MKKYLFFLFFLAISAMSCQKDIEQGSITSAVTPTDTKQTSLFDQTKPVENDDVYVKIDAFKAKLAKIEAGMLPENDNGTSVEDAIWNIEALMNSRYGQASTLFAIQQIEASTIRVPLNSSNAIDNTALLAAVEATRLKLKEQYDAVVSSNKHIIAVDVSLKSVQSESGGFATFSIGSSVGSGGSGQATVTGSSATPFNSADDWFYGEGLGRCDGSIPDKDAAIRISEEINLRNPLSAQSFFTDVELFFAVGDDTTIRTPNDTRDNHRDFFLYLIRRDLSPDDASFNALKCITSVDMNWYYQKAFTVIAIKKPVGKSFISIQLFGESHVFNNMPFILGHIHLATILYGIKHNNYD